MPDILLGTGSDLSRILTNITYTVISCTCRLSLIVTADFSSELKVACVCTGFIVLSESLVRKTRASFLTNKKQELQLRLTAKRFHRFALIKYICSEFASVLIAQSHNQGFDFTTVSSKPLKPLSVGVN